MKTVRFTVLAGMISLLGLVGCHKQPRPQPIIPPPMLPADAIFLPPEPLPPSGTAVPTNSRPTPSPSQNSGKNRFHPRQNGKKITDLNKGGTVPDVPSSDTPTVAPPVAVPRISRSSNSPVGSEDISEGMPHSDEMHHRQTTSQLLQSTEDNLKSIHRGLSNDEKVVLEQINSFLAQSRAAINENDLVRAHNLALKAHLLSDELAGR